MNNIDIVKRLKEFKSCLHSHYRNQFHVKNIDKELKVWRSDDLNLILIWLLRDNPYFPEGYYNQQTTSGKVLMYSTPTHMSNVDVVNLIHQQLKEWADELIALGEDGMDCNGRIGKDRWGIK